MLADVIRLPLWFLGMAVILAVTCVFTLGAVIYLTNRIAILFERRPLRLVRRHFHEQYPDEHIAWLRLRAAEPSRWVVGVFFGYRKPPCYKFFTVDRQNEIINEMRDVSKYAPKVWR